MRFDFGLEGMVAEGLEKGELLTTVYEDFDDIRDSSYNEDIRLEQDNIVEENITDYNAATDEKLTAAKSTDKIGILQPEEQFKTPEPVISRRSHTPRSITWEEESTIPYGMSMSQEASRNSTDNSTRTILVEDLTYVPDDKEKSRRCWLTLLGTNYSVTIADKFDILYCKPVTDRVINFAQQLLKRVTFHVNGMQDCCFVPVEKDGNWVYGVQMSSVTQPSCQIHHTGTDHCVATVRTAEDERIILFDSAQGSPHLPRSLEMQLYLLYTGKARGICKFLRPRVQQQHNGVDCGIFAIAFLTEFVFNQYTGRELLEFDIPKMRDHLLTCFSNYDLTPFPKLNRKMRLKNKTVLLDSTTSVISR